MLKLSDDNKFAGIHITTHNCLIIILVTVIKIRTKTSDNYSFTYTTYSI